MNRSTNPPLTISRPELLRNGSDGQFRRLVHNLFAFLGCHEAIRAGHASRIGLTSIEYTALISVAHLQSDSDVSVKSLAEHLHVSGAFVTTIVGKLLKKGFLSKETDTADRRRLRLAVTGKGEALLADLAPVQQQVNDIQFGCLTATDFDFLNDIVERLIPGGNQAIALQTYLAQHRVREE
jgi:DNA-binding MarR family transcriptional regulator